MTLTGSFRDQSALRGLASPLWSATSASYRDVITHPRKSSKSAIRPVCSRIVFVTSPFRQEPPQQRAWLRFQSRSAICCPEFFGQLRGQDYPHRVTVTSARVCRTILRAPVEPHPNHNDSVTRGRCRAPTPFEPAA